jgi:hypothetical protein
MLTRSAFGLVIALASVSGALAAPRTHANNTQNVYNPSGAHIGAETGTRSEPTVFGWRYTPPQEPVRR